MEQVYAFTCPICGRKTDYPIAELTEGAKITCPYCKLTLNLHGHMLQEIREEIAKLGKKP